MAGRTVKTLLNEATEPTRMQTALAQLRDDSDPVRGFGDIIASFVPGLTTRTGLPSQVTHVDGPLDSSGAVVPEPGRIFAVTSEDGVTNFPIVYGTTAPAVGEVQVIYSATGVPTLTFQAAVTGYRVEKAIMPLELAEALAAPGSA